MHQTSLSGRCFAADAMNDAAPCRTHTFGWYKKPNVALISSHIRIFWNRPSVQRLVSEASTFVTTVSSTSNTHVVRHVTTNGITQGIPDSACIISGKMYSSKLRPPAHAATSTILSKKAYRSSQSRSFRYVIIWLSNTSLVFCRPKKIHRYDMSCKIARFTTLDGSIRSAEICSWTPSCSS